MKITRRRMLLAGCGLAAIAALPGPGHSAEALRAGPRWAPDPRPWADFVAAKAFVEKHESTPAGIDAGMRAQLGPLPWVFTGSPWGTVSIDRLAPMGDPAVEGEMTGVWAVLRYAGPEAGYGVVLLQIGRIVLKMGTPTDWRPSLEETWHRERATRAEITYRTIADDGRLLSTGCEDRDAYPGCSMRVIDLGEKGRRHVEAEMARLIASSPTT